MRVGAIIAATGLFLAAATIQAQTLYSALNIGSLGGPGGTVGTGINDSGTIVGGSIASDGGQHAFSYYDGIMADLGTLGGLSSIANAINTAGTIVGQSSVPGGNDVAFSFSSGTMTELQLSALQGYTGAYGINNAGVIVGAGFVNPNTTAQPYDTFIDNGGTITIISVSGGTVAAQGINNSDTVAGGYALNFGNFFYDPFTYSDGTFTSLGAFGSAWVTYGLAINDSGTVVGYYSDPDTNQGIPHAFSYSNGSYTALGTLPGGSHASAEAINNEGAVVGESNTSFNGNYDAFIDINGVMTDLNSDLLQAIPTTLFNATAINDGGQIVALGANGDTYLLTPVTASAPEPGVVGLLVSGCVTGIALMRRKRLRRPHPRFWSNLGIP